MGIFHSEPFFPFLRAAVSHCVSSFFRIAGSSQLPLVKSNIGDVDANDRTLHHYRKTGHHGRPMGTSTVVVTGDDERYSDCFVSDYVETGNILVTYGHNDEKILKTYAESGCSPDVAGCPRDIDSVPESTRAVKIGSMMLGRSGKTEQPLGSPIPGWDDHGAGNQWSAKAEDGKGGGGNRSRTRSNITNSRMGHSASGRSGSHSNLQPVEPRPRDDQCEGTLCCLRVVVDC